LYYRLSAVSLVLPPLRDRRDSIPALAHCFLERYGAEQQPVVTGIAPKALEILQAFHWPGNIRQLRNVIQSACIVARSSTIQPEDLP
jgi:Nif-specific regulatory protein